MMSTTLTRSRTITQAIDYRLLTISSQAFSDGSSIPGQYTCDGENKNPPLRISGIPSNAISLAIIVDDPDAPIGTWSHWLTWNIPVTHLIRENHQYGEEGLNDFLENRYDGPCPQVGMHHYHFKICVGQSAEFAGYYASARSGKSHGRTHPGIWRIGWNL
jgi:Raf kinase inhibitor-like YbhB/YbcL family protein